MSDEQIKTGDDIISGAEQSPDSKCLKENWIESMVEREATPKPERKETKEDFCKRFGISVSTYEYHQRKDETKEKVLRIWLNEAFNGGNTVLRKLKEKADEGDMKAIELYIKFVLKLAENLDIKSGGKSLQIIFDAAFKTYDSTRKTEGNSTV